MTRALALLLVAGVVVSGCGKYGPPTRTAGAPATPEEIETFEEDENQEPQELP